MKKAFITGVTGQDGSYLAEFLLEKGYEVHGLIRRSSSFNTARIEHIYSDPHDHDQRLVLHYGDLSDSSNLISVLEKVRPDEVYNLGAQSHVAVSFETPEYSASINGLGTLRLLEGIRFLGMESSCRFYQASTSELFGKIQETPQTELTPFYPRSPYAVAKLYAHWITVNYREAYGVYACNGILFNHESERRGETFVTRKITRGLSRIALGLQNVLFLGNFEAKRDWGFARDYVEMQWLMLQQKEPEDFVISTGIQASVRDFAQLAAKKLGFEIEWRGVGVGAVGVVSSLLGDNELEIKVGDVIIRTDPKYYRPAEVEDLLGDSRLARVRLGWCPRVTLEDLVERMVLSDLALARREKILADSNLEAGTSI